MPKKTKRASARKTAIGVPRKTSKKIAKKTARKTTRKTASRGTTSTARLAEPEIVRLSKAGRRVRAVGAAADVAVTMALTFPGGGPADVMFVRRIAGVERVNGKANVARGTHTAGWDVVSPTVRPVTFDVTITEDATGRVALDRSGERTGDDGRGAGADRFTV